MINDVLYMCSNVQLSIWLSVVKLLGRYQGKNGQIEIVECSWDGTRVYFEEGVRQSQATPDGESVFTYVKLMDELLSRSAANPHTWAAAAEISRQDCRVSANG